MDIKQFKPIFRMAARFYDNPDEEEVDEREIKEAIRQVQIQPENHAKYVNAVFDFFIKYKKRYFYAQGQPREFRLLQPIIVLCAPYKFSTIVKSTFHRLTSKNRHDEYTVRDEPRLVGCVWDWYPAHENYVKVGTLLFIKYFVTTYKDMVDTEDICVYDTESGRAKHVNRNGEPCSCPGSRVKPGGKGVLINLNVDNDDSRIFYSQLLTTAMSV